MSDVMGTNRADTHIGMFTADQCRELLMAILSLKWTRKHLQASKAGI